MPTALQVGSFRTIEGLERDPAGLQVWMVPERAKAEQRVEAHGEFRSAPHHSRLGRPLIRQQRRHLDQTFFRDGTPRPVLPGERAAGTALRQVLIPISAVLIPLLSRLQSYPERYRRTFMHVFAGLGHVPFAAMCLVLSRPLVLVVLGPKWTSVIPLFSAFAVVAVSSPLPAASSWMSRARAAVGTSCTATHWLER